MDRISGLLPQIGWSPLMAVTTPRKAPSTTVEPATGSAGTEGGMGAEVGAQFSRARDGQAPAPPDQDPPRIEPPPDLDQPTGPPPAFEMTFLEAQAARWRADPSTIGRSTETADLPAAAEDKAAAADGRREDEAPALQKPAAAGVRAEWPTLTEPPGSTLDLTR